MTIKGKTVGFVGAGNMGEALIKGLLAASRVPADAIFATDVRQERLKDLDRQYGIQVAAGNVELVRGADVVILAVKPQIMDDVLKEIAPAVTRRKLLISIAAGVSTPRLRAGWARTRGSSASCPTRPRSSSRASRRSPRRRASSPATSTSPARSSARSGVWSCSARTCWTP